MHYRAWIAGSAIVIAVVSASSASGQSRRRDDLAVYAAAAKLVLSGNDSLVIVRASTRPKEGSFDKPDVVRQTKDLDTSAVADFLRVNAEPRAMPRIVLEGPVVRLEADSVLDSFGQVMNSSGTRSTNPREYWNEFGKRFPGASGVLSFSGVGFSREGDVAIVGVGFSCGGLCGNGQLVVLRKRLGKWIAVKTLSGWVS